MENNILFSSEYFHYKTFFVSTSRGTPRKFSRYPRVPRNPGWESLIQTNADPVDVTVNIRTGHLLPASNNHVAYSSVGIIHFGAESCYVALVIKK